MVKALLADMGTLLFSYKFPQIVLGLTIAYMIWTYLAAPNATRYAKNKIVQDADGDFVPLPPGADDEEQITHRRSSVNADLQDIRMRRQIRMKAGWKARGWADSELMAPKSRRWDG